MNKRELNDEPVEGRSDSGFRVIETFADYVGQDLAQTHRITKSVEAANVDPNWVDEQYHMLLRRGYVILERVVSPALLDALRTSSAPWLAHTGRNSFEGARTQRIYGLPEKVSAAEPFVVHPRVLAVLDRVFQPNYLLSQAQVINIMSGSAAQPLHIDDGFYPFPRPRPPLSAATVFAIDDFTENNGATVLIEGSHTWGEERRPRSDDVRIKAIMPAGSCVL